MDVRLRDLLAQFPDHPLLQQLRTIVQRLLSMQLSSPLKAALTGLELLLSRAQVRRGRGPSPITPGQLPAHRRQCWASLWWAGP